MLLALLLGMALSFLADEGRCVPGIEFSGRSVQRLGVALLGARISFDLLAALPYILLVLLVLSAFGSELQYFVVLLGLYGWERYARLARSQAVSAREQGYALAISAVGASPARLYLRHVLPNISSALIVTATLIFPQIVLLESSLSFLGLGVQPPQTSLGNMVAFGRDYLMTAWWIVAAPAIVILITSLAFTLLGETLRDRLDPTLADRT